MLTIVVPAASLFNDTTGEFIETKETRLQMEHSLLAVSRWESKWHKPYLGDDERTFEEQLDYVRCMTITPNVDPNVYLALTPTNILEINAYVEDPATATTFSNIQQKGFGREVITSELIYYWMISLQIPFECQKWKLNRLITLIRVCAIKNQPEKMMNRRDIANRNRALNAARRAQLGTRG